MSAPSPATRDPRLDVFRGLAMVIILIAHIPSNGWAEWIPARFGFSDATEIFVFCSGFASALAYGRVFDRQGFAAGASRVLARLRLLYAAHLGVFAAIVGALALAEAAGGGDALRGRLALGALLEAPLARGLEVLSLTHVPNAFDILPMYIVVLALVPVVMALERRGRAAVAAVALTVWALAGGGFLSLPADLATGRAWFFNPFAWQLLFFLGFGFARGWLRPPSPRPAMLALAFAVLALAAPVSCHAGWACHAGWGLAPWLGGVHAALLPFADKTALGPLRLAHFLALALVAWALAGESGRRLAGPVAGPLRLVGRQSLATFLAGLWLAQALGLALDHLGRDAAATAFANLAGLATLVLVAYVVERTKARSRPVPRAGFAAAPGRV